MSGLFRKISNTLKRLGRSSSPLESPSPVDRRTAPRFICSVPVLWEVGRESGDATLREVSATGMRLKLQRALLAGKNIRVRPAAADDRAPLSSDVAIGQVVYCRARSGMFEIGIEFVNPERISKYAWLKQLLREQRVSGVDSSHVGPDNPSGLTLVKRRENLSAMPHKIG